ncbi:zinc finger protein 79-like [Ixodes scapularis]
MTPDPAAVYCDGCGVLRIHKVHDWSKVHLSRVQVPEVVLPPVLPDLHTALNQPGATDAVLSYMARRPEFAALLSWTAACSDARGRSDGRVPAEADDGDGGSDSSSPRSELVESLPTMRPRCEGMYRCEFCPYSSSYLKSVINHERTHTGEKPFSCEVCQKAFARNDVLANHKRVHTGEKPYQCGTCEKNFSQRNNMLRHERTHKYEACDKNVYTHGQYMWA